MSCTKEAIRAHSIQNSRVLDLIHKNGHVITPTLRYPIDGPKVGFVEIGRNKASTFTGFCEEHDSSIFKPLDTQEFNPQNPEQIFLLAYRSVTQELHVVMQGAMKIQGSYLKRVEDGLDPENEPSHAGVMATNHMIKSYNTWLYRHENFDSHFKSKSWNTLSYDIIELNDQPPVLAASALFSFTQKNVRDDLVRCAINVFPTSNSKSYVIFCYSTHDAKKARKSLRHIFQSKGRHQRYLLSKLIIDRIENFALCPDHFKSWSELKKSKVINAFSSNIENDKPIKDDHELMLF